MSIARLFRQRCPKCSSRRLSWSTAETLGDLPARDRQVSELVARFPLEERRDVEVWRCDDCGDAGAFGAAHLTG